MAIFWRILHLLIARYGNQPMGQLLVALTLIFLNQRGAPPTLADLGEATGLSKTSISRYVSWQLSEGLVTEEIDPSDRRRRFLLQTAKGKREWRWQMNQMRKLFDDIQTQAETMGNDAPMDTAADIMEKMINATQNAPPRLRRDSKL